MTTSYPLTWPDGWPRTPDDKRRARSQFSTTLDRARRQLLDELRMLGAQGVVISTNLPLRNDGAPRSDVARFRIGDPGVAVYFLLRKRRMVMARDAFWNVHDNLRSIGHAIAHLRGLERHGGASMMERAFEGFAALPPPDQPPARPWLDVLGLVSLAADPAVVLAAAEGVFRSKARTTHTDAGGDHDAMAELNRAIADARKELGDG